MPPLCPLLCSAARAKAEAIEGIEEVLQSGVENNLLELLNMSAAEIADGISSFGSMLEEGSAPNAEAFELILAFMHEVKALRDEQDVSTALVAL